MKPWVCVILLGCLAAAGCRSHGRQGALLERENRQLEDALYDLQYELETCQEEKASLEKKLGRFGPADRSTGRNAPREPGAPELLSPYSGRASGPEIAPLRPPTIQQGAEVVPDEDLPEMLVPSPSPELRRPTEAAPADPPRDDHGEDPASAGKFVMPPLSGPDRSDDDLPGKAVSTDSDQVKRIAVNPKRTGGYDADGRPGDEGIVVVLEPQTDAQRLVAAAAPVSVVLLDPNLPGQAARVARWDFSLDEVARLYGESPPGEGLRLKMPWPDAPPVNSRLHLFVRYTTSDGTQHEADGEIRVALAGGPAQGWSVRTPRDPGPPVANRTAAPRQGNLAEDTRPAAAPVPAKPGPAPAEEPIRTAARPMPPSAPPARQRPTWSPER
jgi:hypothetical protein